MGENEKISFEVDVANWGTPIPDQIQVVLTDKDGADITSNHVVGAAIVMNETVIISGRVQGLKKNNDYRLDWIFEDDTGNTLNPYAWLVVRR